MRRTEYRTQEARQSAINNINECINAVQRVPSSMLGTIVQAQTVMHLIEYKKLIEADLKENK